MNIIALITAFLRAYIAKLERDARVYPETLHDEADAIEDRIEAFRDLGTPAATDAADRMRKRLARKRGLAEALSAVDSAVAGGAESADAGRDLSPTSAGDLAQRPTVSQP